MDLIVSCVWIAVELSSILLYEHAFLKPRYTRARTILVMLAVYLFTLSVDTGWPVALPFEIQKVINLSSCVLWALLLFTGPWYLTAAAAVSSYFFLAALDVVLIYGAAALLGLSLEELIWNRWLYIAVGSADKLICFLVYFLVYRLARGSFWRGRSLRRVLLSAIFPLISTMGLMGVYYNNQSRDELSVTIVLFAVLLLLANAGVIFLLSSLDRASAAEKELALLNRSRELQTESYRALEKSYRAQRAATHEFKHQLQTIDELLSAGHTDEAVDYVRKLQGGSSTRLFAANSGSTIVDAILNEKYQRARRRAIDVRYQLSDLSGLVIQTDALVVLLSNLLDNAIEGCERASGDRVLECSLVLTDSLLLSVRNTAPFVRIVDGRIETTKEPRAEHGFGLPAVERIVSQLHGEFALDYTEPWFQAVVELPNTPAPLTD